MEWKLVASCLKPEKKILQGRNHILLLCSCEVLSTRCAAFQTRVKGAAQPGSAETAACSCK